MRSALKRSLAGGQSQSLGWLPFSADVFMLDLFPLETFLVFEDYPCQFLLFHIGWMLSDSFELRFLWVVGLWRWLRCRFWFWLETSFHGAMHKLAWMILFWHGAIFVGLRAFAWPATISAKESAMPTHYLLSSPC